MPQIAQEETKPFDVRNGTVMLTVRMVPQDRERLRKLSEAEGCSMSDMILDGLDHVMAEKGDMIPLTRWSSKTGRK